MGKDGGFVFFQLSKINLRANSVVNLATVRLPPLRGLFSLATPKMANTGSGSNTCPKLSESVRNIEVQNCDSFGHDQNI